MANKFFGELKKQKGLWLALGGLLFVYIFYGYINTEGNFFGSMNYMPDDYYDDTTNIIIDDDNTQDASSQTTTFSRNGMYSSKPDFTIDKTKNYTATIKTNYGDIKVDLYENKTPVTVNNFVFLSNENFYSGLIFHRVVKDFVIQGGDPLGNGSGGPGYTFNDEVSITDKFEPYVLAMANAGKDATGKGTNGSQFFITTKNSNTEYLAGKHTIFGKVIDGFDVVDKIENVKVDPKTNKPEENIYIERVEIKTQ